MVQFGVAGLMAWMWTSERRASQERERQLTESHERLMEQRTQLSALLDAITQATRAVTALEASQRAIVSALRALGADPKHAPRDADEAATTRSRHEAA
ncbi:MAG: hypothetical protein ACKVZJ_14820 [Phycisphaerales bacterium]